MDYAVLLGALAVVIAVKALTAMALNKQELMLKRVTGDDRELGSKIAALNATERQLTREKKASEEQLQELEAEKDRLLLAIQKFGATPVEEPTEEEVFGFRNQTTVPAGPVSTDKVGEKGPDGTLLDEPGGVVEEDEERLLLRTNRFHQLARVFKVRPDPELRQKRVSTMRIRKSACSS